MQAAPNICVIIAAKDAEAMIADSIVSALGQPEVRQVIVVDDGSTDATADVAMAADDGSNRLVVIRREVNLGPSAARNLALAKANADFICVLDADDRLRNGRFARMFDQGELDWDFLADDLLLAPETTPDTPISSLIGVPEGVSRHLATAEFVRGNIPDPRRPRQEFGYLKPLMRREFLIRSGLTYDETLRLGEDYVLYVQAMLRGARFKLIPACGYIAVQRAGSLSHAHGPIELAALVAAADRLINDAADRDPGAAQALRAHRHSVQMNLDHRLMLEAKQCGDWPAVVRRLLRTPSTTAYIVARTLRAKVETHKCYGNLGRI